MAIIGGPPILTIRHQRIDIRLHRRKIEGLKFFGIVKAFVHRIDQFGMLAQYFQIELIGPPIGVGPCARRRSCSSAMHHGAFAGAISITIHRHFVHSDSPNYAFRGLVLDFNRSSAPARPTKFLGYCYRFARSLLPPCFCGLSRQRTANTLQPYFIVARQQGRDFGQNLAVIMIHPIAFGGVEQIDID